MLFWGAASVGRFWNMDAPSTTALTASVASPMMVSTSMAARTTPSASASSTCSPRVMDCEQHYVRAVIEMVYKNMLGKAEGPSAIMACSTIIKPC